MLDVTLKGPCFDCLYLAYTLQKEGQQSADTYWAVVLVNTLQQIRGLLLPYVPWFRSEEWYVEEHYLSWGSPPNFRRDLWDTSPAGGKVHGKFKVQRWGLFLSFKTPTGFAVIDKERNLWCSW